VVKYKIIVTDVTCYGDRFCVAGWDPGARAMIRPEPPGADPAIEATRFWDWRFAGPGKFFSVGSVVEFDASPPPPDFPFPHSTEDRIVDWAQPKQTLRNLDNAQMVQAVAAGVSPTMMAAFDGALIREVSGKAYVPTGSPVRSLGAIEVAAKQISFHEESYQGNKPKLRAYLTHDGRIYDLSVTADAVRTRWKAAGLAGLQADARESNRVHVRVGLARPFAGKPNECYSQVNGACFL
jgi:hypothetical protein